MLNTNPIKNNELIRLSILKRMNDENLQQRDLIADAAEHGMSISAASLSRYLKPEREEKRSILTDFQVLWICARWCIRVEIIVQLDKYDYKSAMKRIKAQ